MLTAIKDSYDHPRSLGVLYALIFEAVGPIPELGDRFKAFHRREHARIASYIRRGLEDGSIIKGVDPENQAAVIIGQLRGVGYLWKLDPEGIDAGSVLTLFIDQLLNQIAREPSAPRRRKREVTA
jgi:hypothetical protein